MDIRMPGLDGLEATRRITSDPDLAALRIIMLTTFDLDDYVYEALRSGASGFLLKDAPPRTSSMPCGSSPPARRCSPPASPAGSSSASPPTTADRPPIALNQLTERESEVLRLVAQGLSNAEIADRLYISLFTAKTHVSRILTKLHARRPAQLVMLAYETHLVTPGGT